MSVKQLFKAHEINYVVFMGSIENAHDVYTDVAENDFIDVQLDLGGKDGAYVAPDCNFDLTLQTLVKGAYYNTGQSRNSIQRIYVHKDISSTFINAFTKKVFEDLKMGDPMNEDTYIGPMAVLDHVE
jgi:acyl-CoA reductase-like NAD-dependent aldehyde dehydrogenase